MIFLSSDYLLNLFWPWYWISVKSRSHCTCYLRFWPIFARNTFLQSYKFIIRKVILMVYVHMHVDTRFSFSLFVPPYYLSCCNIKFVKHLKRLRLSAEVIRNIESTKKEKLKLGTTYYLKTEHMTLSSSCGKAHMAWEGGGTFNFRMREVISLLVGYCKLSKSPEIKSYIVISLETICTCTVWLFALIITGLISPRHHYWERFCRKWKALIKLPLNQRAINKLNQMKSQSYGTCFIFRTFLPFLFL